MALAACAGRRAARRRPSRPGRCRCRRRPRTSPGSPTPCRAPSRAARTAIRPSTMRSGRRYYVLPAAEGYDERGVASWYGPTFHGGNTSSGEPYDMYAMTAAHKTLPLPSYARVTNLEATAGASWCASTTAARSSPTASSTSRTPRRQARHAARRDRDGGGAGADPRSARGAGSRHGGPGAAPRPAAARSCAALRAGRRVRRSGQRRAAELERLQAAGLASAFVLPPLVGKDHSCTACGSGRSAASPNSTPRRAARRARHSRRPAGGRLKRCVPRAASGAHAHAGAPPGLESRGSPPAQGRHLP